MPLQLRVNFLVCVQILGLLILSALSVRPSFGDLIYAPVCEGPECIRTATPSGWPTALENSAFSMEVERYSFHLPSPPARVIRQGGGDVFIACRNGNIFNFGFETNLAGAAEVEMPAQSTFTVADSAEMIFTKTTADAPPRDPNDLWVWRRAIFEKKQIFSPKNEVYSARKGPLTVYFWQDNQRGGAVMAYLFNATNRSSYVRIFAKGISFDDFKKLLGTAELKKI